MSRPVHYIDSTDRDYEFVSKDPWVVEFRAAPKEQAHLRKPRAILSTTKGLLVLKDLKVKIVPGPPVDGRLLVQVSGERM